MSDVDHELIAEFLVEAREIVADVEVTLMNLERGRLHDGVVDNEALHAAFRGFHTVKGVAGFFNFDLMVKTAHESENLLDQLRSDELELVADHVTVLCEALDHLTTALDGLEATGRVGLTEEQVEALAVQLRKLGKDGKAAKAAAEEPTVAGAEPAEAAAEPTGTEAEPPEAAAQPTEALAQPAEAPAEPAEATAEPAEATAEPTQPTPGSAEPAEVRSEPAPVPAATATPEPSQAAAVPEAAPAPPTPTKATPAPPPVQAQKLKVGDPPPKGPRGNAPSGGGGGGGSGGSSGNRSIRVDLQKLDQLMNLVGELIIAQNVLAHMGNEEGTSQRAGQQLDRVTRNLQHLAMSMRMVPIRALFRKMVRVVRDVARRQGKEVRVELVGEETEVDKTVIEAISDPLVHLVRNAVDHGIEVGEKRRERGKPAEGVVTLSARHESGEVRVTIQDDGNGLDTDRILKKAVAKGLLAEDATPEPSEIRDLIFAPGFSTAQTVTSVSGRGVGMDVVRRNVESVRGRVDVDSAMGSGTSFTLRLPLTLAIIEGMMMRLGDQVFTVPLLTIKESVSLREHISVRLPSGDEIVDLRGTMVPLLPMQRLVPYERVTENIERPILVVIEEDGRRAGILADELIGQRQVVIKPIPTFLSHVEGLTGCSILGNGQISLILDVKFLLASVRDIQNELASSNPSQSLSEVPA